MAISDRRWWPLVALVVGLGLLGTSTEAQGLYWTLLNGNLRSNGPVVVGPSGTTPTGTFVRVASTTDPTTANNGESVVYSSLTMANPANNVTGIGVQGYVLNNGSIAGDTAHHIGTLGLVQDTASGQQTLYGIEGKAEGRGIAGAQIYAGGIFFGNFQGSAFAGTNVGVKVLANVTTDGSTPLTQGTNYGIQISPLVGGATAYAILHTDPVALQTATGAMWIRGSISEELTLNSGGTASDSTASLLPANSLIEAVVARVTVAITGATLWNLGDPTTGARFIDTTSTVAAGSTFVGLRQWDPSVATTTATGPTQTAAAKVRINADAPATAGKIRVVVFYRQFVPPTQ